MRSKKSLNKNSAPLVIYDAEEDLSRKCSLCFLDNGPFVNPCRCNMQYHQKCMLRYIREKLVSMKHELDLTLIKCQVCNHQIRFLHYDHTHYSCIHFCRKIKKNWCNKTLIFMFFVFLITIAIGIILAGHHSGDGAVYYGLLIGESILCVILLASLVIFIQTNLTYKQIILVKYSNMHIQLGTIHRLLKTRLSQITLVRKHLKLQQMKNIEGFVDNEKKETHRKRIDEK